VGKKDSSGDMTDRQESAFRVFACWKQFPSDDVRPDDSVRVRRRHEEERDR
jgi:hypothetical protein